MTRALVLSILTLSACGRLPAGGRAASPRPLRLASYNVNYGLAHDAETHRAIATIDSDVVLLQEVGDAWLAALDASRFRHVCVARSAYPAGGAAILSRRPLADCQVSRSEVGWFPALAATVRAPFGEVRLVNVHLQPARGGASALADLPELPERHRREIDAHVARLVRPGLPTIFAGDFNEGDGEGAVGELSTRGYASALALHQPSATTWRWPVGAMTIEKRLDHVLYDRRLLECLHAQVLEAGSSDHRPVVARFRPLGRPAPLLGSSLLTGRGSALTPR